MAKITLDLNRFKASGVYTLEFDQSETITLNTETVRLVTGFSRTGPINTVVFLKDNKTAKKIFGEIDTFLEKRGSYFHRSLETCLQTGPVLALNLLPLNNVPVSQGGDAVTYRSFAVSANEENGPISKSLYSSFYNKERFWFPDPDNFIALTNFNFLNKDRLLHFTNLSKRPMSIIIRKPNPKVSGFELTAKDWYGNGNVPDFINESDFIEDYFIEVIAIEGDWTNYDSLSKDPKFSKYFSNRGVLVNKLNEFLSLEEVTLIGRFVGSIIPDFTDKNGSNLFIETIINNSTLQTGIFCAVNKKMFDDYLNSTYKLDLIGHSLIGSNDDAIDFLSYNTSIKEEMEYADMNNSTSPSSFPGPSFTYALTDGTDAWVESRPIKGDSGYFHNVLVLKKPSPTVTTGFTLTDYNFILNNLKEGLSLIKTLGTIGGIDAYMKVEKIIELSDRLEIVLSNPEINLSFSSNYLDLSLFSINTSTNEIVVNGNYAPPISSGDIIYVEGPGFSEYYEVTSASNSGANTNIIIKTSSLTATSPTYASKFVKTDLNNLNSSLTANSNDVSLYKVKVWDVDSTSGKSLVIDLTTVPSSDQLKIVYEPDFVSEVISDPILGDYFESYPGSKIAKDILNSRLVDGDIIYYGSNPSQFNYIKIDKEWNYLMDPNGSSSTQSFIFYGIKGIRIRQYSDKELINQSLSSSSNYATIDSSYKRGTPTNTIYNPNAGADLIFYSSNVKDFRYDVEIKNENALKTKFTISDADKSKIEIGYFIYNDNLTNQKLTRVISKKKKLDSLGNIVYEIETLDPVQITYSGSQKFIKVQKPINVFADVLQFTHLSGFKLTDFHLPDGSETQLEKILSVIENTKIGETLASKDMVNFRYIIDTFDGGLQPMMGAKSILSRLAKNRQKCMAILNAPSIKKFMESTDPLFTDPPDPDAGNPNPTLNTEYIAQGGNLSLGPSYTFSLPDEENGAKFIGIFSPFLVYRENNKNILVPPAADVSNNFIRKFLSGQPYAIVAGPRLGILSNPKLIGLEYDYTLKDRENLEPFGINPIINVRNVGIMIYANQSAYQKVTSAFNNLHVRDLLITIESGVEDILTQYLFQFNDATTRLEIKSIVENYLDKVRNAGGVNDFIVIMDSTNNTPDIIDENFGVIDIAIEPARGIQKFINRITILKTGAIASGGFTIA